MHSAHWQNGTSWVVKLTLRTKKGKRSTKNKRISFSDLRTGLRNVSFIPIFIFSSFTCHEPWFLPSVHGADVKEKILSNQTTQSYLEIGVPAVMSSAYLDSGVLRDLVRD